MVTEEDFESERELFAEIERLTKLCNLAQQQLTGEVEAYRLSDRIATDRMQKAEVVAKEWELSFDAAVEGNAKLASYCLRLKTEIERLTAENAALQSLIQHPGDGTCDRCGSTPAVPVNLCEECRAKVQS